jgi:hypothetical protein
VSRASADTHDRSRGAAKISDGRAENGIVLDSGSVRTSEQQRTNGKRETIIDMWHQGEVLSASIPR